MKITLGTVQFGINYGISNQFGIPSDEELKSIFSVAKALGIHNLDTANAYGNAEERIGQFANNQFKVISKFSNVSSKLELENSLLKSLENLHSDSIYGYLAHNADVLIENPALWDVLLESKKSKKVQKIGFSLYYPEQLDKLIEMNCIPDLVQLPYSILDRKFEKQLTILNGFGTEVHVRSVFLQGLYFMNPNELPENLQPLKSALLELQILCKESNLSIGQVALNYVSSNPNIDQLVIGIETANQLIENVSLISNWSPNLTIFSKIENIKIIDKSLLNPSLWK